MKTLKYLIATIAVVFALVGCTSGSGSANFDTPMEDKVIGTNYFVGEGEGQGEGGM